jgi:hypothetical protein
VIVARWVASDDASFVAALWVRRRVCDWGVHAMEVVASGTPPDGVDLPFTLTVMQLAATAKQHYTIEVRSSDTVVELKNKILAAGGPPPSHQRLIMCGNVLVDDGATLAACGMSKATIVHLVAINPDSNSARDNTTGPGPVAAVADEGGSPVSQVDRLKARMAAIRDIADFFDDERLLMEMKQLKAQLADAEVAARRAAAGGVDAAAAAAAGWAAELGLLTARMAEIKANEDFFDDNNLVAEMKQLKGRVAALKAAQRAPTTIPHGASAAAAAAAAARAAEIGRLKTRMATIKADDNFFDDDNLVAEMKKLKGQVEGLEAAQREAAAGAGGGSDGAAAAAAAAAAASMSTAVRAPGTRSCTGLPPALLVSARCPATQHHVSPRWRDSVRTYLCASTLTPPAVCDASTQ